MTASEDGLIMATFIVGFISTPAVILLLTALFSHKITMYWNMLTIFLISVALILSIVALGAWIDSGD